MPKPALDKIVLVTVDPHANNGTDTAPAVICRVWSDALVNLRVLRDGPDVPWLTSVPLFHDRQAMEEERARRVADGTMAGGAIWHAAFWPPYKDHTLSDIERELRRHPGRRPKPAAGGQALPPILGGAS